MEEELKYHLDNLNMLQFACPEGKNPAIASCLKNIGMFYKELGDVKTSFKYLEDALEMERALYPGQNHLDIADTLYKFGIAHEDINNFAKAIKYYEDALEMRRALYPGQNHPDIILCLNSLGWDFAKLGDDSKALKYFKEALEMQKALDANSDGIFWIFDQIGTIYYKLGDLEEIINFTEQALEMKQKLLQVGDQNYYRLANSFSNLGDAYEKFGDACKAAEYFKLAYLVDTQIVDNPDPTIPSSTIATKRYVESKYPVFLMNNETRELIVQRGSFDKSILQIKRKLQKTVLNKICNASSDGHWNSRSILGFKKWGVKDYLDETYICQQLGSSANPETIESAKMLCFEAVCLGIMNGVRKIKNFTCAKEFANTFPKVTENIVRDHPEYFVDGSILRQCVNDPEILYKMVGKC